MVEDFAELQAYIGYSSPEGSNSGGPRLRIEVGEGFCWGDGINSENKWPAQQSQEMDAVAF